MESIEQLQLPQPNAPSTATSKNPFAERKPKLTPATRSESSMRRPQFLPGEPNVEVFFVYIIDLRGYKQAYENVLI